MQLSLAYLINLEIYLNLSYEITYSWAQPVSLLRFCNSFNSTEYLNENETKLIQIYLRVSVIILHHLYQKRDTKRNLWVVLHIHIAQLMTHTTSYVTKPFGILQRIIKSQRVYIYHLDSAKFDTFSLRKVKAAKFSEIFGFKFSGLIKSYKKFRPYQCAVFKKGMFLLCQYEEMYSHFKLLIETFSYFVR